MSFPVTFVSAETAVSQVASHISKYRFEKRKVNVTS